MSTTMKHIDDGASGALVDVISSMMREDENIVLYGVDCRSGIGCAFVHPAMGYEFGPDRIFDMPVNENLIGYSAMGMALAGMKPIVEFGIADFTSLAFDSIVNNAAKVRFWSHGKTSCPVVYLAAAGTGTRCGCTHGQSIEGWFANVPGLKIVVPTDPADCKGLMRTAINDPDPVLFIFPRVTMYCPADIPEEQYSIPFGQARIAREGKDVTIVAWQLALSRALEAATELEAEGISAEVIDPRTLNPLDMDSILKSVEKTGHLVVAHEAVGKFGPGAEICAEAAEKGAAFLKAPPARACTPATCIPTFEIEDEIVARKEDIKQAVLKVLGK